MHPAGVASDVGSIVGALMVVAEGRLVEAINDVGALEVLLSEMVSAMSSFGILADYV